jgi:hypothetical protein
MLAHISIYNIQAFFRQPGLIVFNAEIQVNRPYFFIKDPIRQKGKLRHTYDVNIYFLIRKSTKGSKSIF